MFSFFFFSLTLSLTHSFFLSLSLSLTLSYLKLFATRQTPPLNDNKELKIKTNRRRRSIVFSLLFVRNKRQRWYWFGKMEDSAPTEKPNRICLSTITITVATTNYRYLNCNFYTTMKLLLLLLHLLSSYYYYYYYYISLLQLLFWCLKLRGKRTIQ